MYIDPLMADLEAENLEGLLVVAASAEDPDMAPFAGGAHVRSSLLVANRRRREVKLGFFTPMEREEAAATGLPLLTPEELDIPRWDKTLSDPGEHLAAVLGQALLRAQMTPGKVALAGHFASGVVLEACRRLEADGFAFFSGHRLLERYRKTKSERQVEEIRRAAEGTGVAFRRVAALLAAAGEGENGELILQGEPLTVGRLRREIGRVLADRGLQQPDGNIVAPAEESAVPHNAGTDTRVLRRGESLIVDLYPKGLLYADCTRTFCVGEPPPELARAHGAVLEALQEAHRTVAPGQRGWELQQRTCEILGGHGYATPISEPGTVTGYVHNLGHGTGFELHELPSFRETAGEREGRLASGDVLTLEPGLYEPEGGWGVRLEDLVGLGPDGPENLTPWPYALDPRAWLEEV
ncbi:MAG: M24 family metallopeptidase [Acidobacteriota bacterium]|nr:M24 family metallopeptidase [Acidobacteriota bacterium]